MEYCTKCYTADFPWMMTSYKEDPKQEHPSGQLCRDCAKDQVEQNNMQTV